uniref:ML domain-containing protein n=1 Tax=Panagrellus redivivus TaxID=6233 RepID=A0A7E4VQL6_PANRE
MAASPLAICVLVAVLTVSAATFTPLNYKNCKSGYTIKSVNVDNAEIQGDHAVFKRGTKPTIQIEFEAGADTPSLTASVRSKLAGGTTFSNFQLTPDDACVGGSLPCPLAAGKTYTYTQSVEIADTYPIVQDVQVNWALSSGGKTREICIIFLANVAE